VCEQHKHGSVGAGTGNRPGYPTSGDGRGALAATPLGADAAASVTWGCQAAAGSAVVAHAAANAAGVRIPSAECGRLWL
jgi:hypothetical protein